MLSHEHEAATKATAKYYGVKLTGTMGVCEDCATAKARQKNLNRGDGTKRATEKGQRLYFDISSIKNESFGKSKFWLLIVDEVTDYCWSYFLKKKSETAGVVVALIKDLKAKENITVKFCRCDNAGENKTAEALCKKEGLGVTFEFTAPNTPQHNAQVERKFATLYGRVRSNLNSSQLDDDLRKGLWAECAGKATSDENMCLGPGEEKPPYTLLFGKDPKLFWETRKFGSMAIVKKTSKIQNKLENTGKPCIFVNYASNHASDVYRFLNLETKAIVMSRDVRWLNKTYYEWKFGKDPELQVTYIPTRVKEVIENEKQPESVAEPEAGRESEVTSAPAQISAPEETAAEAPKPRSENAKLIRELSRLGTWYNEDAQEALKRAQAQGTEIENITTGRENESATERDIGSAAFDRVSNKLFGDFAFFVRSANVEKKPATQKVVELPDDDDKLLELLTKATLGRNMNEEESSNLLRSVVGKLKETKPDTFQQAYNHPNLKMKELWRKSIKKEFHSMIVRQVWRKIKRRDMPRGRRCVKSKWVFDVKRSGLFKVRLVACGYSQIPGVDFTENYAPVINDISWRILIVAKMLFGLSSRIIDVETAFLYGELEEGQEIYMECPKGMKELDKSTSSGEEECLQLKRSIYGLVQSA